MRECQIDRCRQLILSISLLGILLTGTLVGLSSALPMFFSAREHVENAALDSLETRAGAINSLLDGYQDIARQFTSRTEIRRRLEAYQAGELSFDELVAFTRPRLKDPMSKLPELLFMRRTGKDMDAIVSLGHNPGVDLEHAHDTGVSILPTPAAEGFVVKAVGAITDETGRRIGMDVLLFSAERLKELLQPGRGFSGQARLVLVQLSTDGHVLASLGDDRALAHSLTGHQNDLTELQPRTLIHARDKTSRFLLTPLQLDNWALVAQLPRSDLYAKANRQLLLTSGVILVMMLLGLMLTRRTLSPLVSRITQQTQRLEESAAELRLSANVFEHAQEAIIVTDGGLRIQRSNRASNDILGYSPESLLNSGLDRLFDQGSHQQDHIELILHTLNRDDAWQGEVSYRHADGHIIPTLQTISVVRNDEGHISHLIHIFNDITDAKENERRMQRLASLDSLTGLPNRAAQNRHIERQLQLAAQQQQRCALLFIDLDNFKPVNDTHGHAAGDQLLKAVAKRLKHAIRTEDSVGRIGGDEFLVLTGALENPDDADVIASKLIQHLLEPFHINEHSVQIGASIGIAHFPDDATDVQTLTRLADQAMYAAKRQGRNCFVRATHISADQ